MGHLLATAYLRDLLVPFVDEGLVLEPDGRPGCAVRRVVVDDWYQA
ncbi:hypothetical protein [Streptomyces sp. NPDC002088]